MHECEPTLEQLTHLYRTLMAAESTDANMKKLHALDVQIKRRRKENAGDKEEG